MTTTPTPDLSSLMLFIGERYTFTDKNYPGLDQLTPEQRKVFAVRHSQLHMSKSAGAIATEAEAADHGGQMDQERLKVATTKMLINSLKLAEELGMTPEDLAACVPSVMKSK